MINRLDAADNQQPHSKNNFKVSMTKLKKMSYRALFGLDPDQYIKYKSIMRNATKILPHHCYKDVIYDCSRDFHKLFPAFRLIDSYINLDNYHQYYDKNKGDMRLGWLIQNSRNIMFATEQGKHAYALYISYIAAIMIRSGYDFSDPEIQKNYCLQCDYFLIQHNRNYAFRYCFKLQIIKLSDMHNIVYKIIDKINNKTFTADSLQTDICPHYSLRRKTKITDIKRKRQLTCCEKSMQTYAKTYDQYIYTLYNIDPFNIPSADQAAERRSYHYQLHKYGIKSSEPVGRPSK